ncbi:putative RING-H2 finger protein ATL69 [Bienertia sinuspersici]
MSTPIPPIPHESPTTNINISTTSGVGLGYGIAIAVSILVLISTIMLASYACVRFKSSSSGGPRQRNPTISSNDNDEESNYPNPTRPTVNGLPGPFTLKLGCDMQPKNRIAYPEVVLGESKRLPKPNTGPCSICLSEYKPKQTVRCMPDCNHCFHVNCIDQWLKMSPTCPLCRNSPAPSVRPTPSGTPLSEVVPLASHPR